MHNEVIDRINAVILTVKDDVDVGKISDGYHTFDELYDHRVALSALAFNMMHIIDPAVCWKSMNHHDPNEPMYENMFIVGMNLPEGQISYHYDIKYWEDFSCKELERAPKYDGHTPADVVERIMKAARLLAVNS